MFVCDCCDSHNTKRRAFKMRTDCVLFGAGTEFLYRHNLYTCQSPNINRLTPNDPYMGRTAPLTSKRCILYIHSTNIGTEYFNPLNTELNPICQ